MLPDPLTLPKQGTSCWAGKTLGVAVSIHREENTGGGQQAGHQLWRIKALIDEKKERIKETTQKCYLNVRYWIKTFSTGCNTNLRQKHGKTNRQDIPEVLGPTLTDWESFAASQRG